MTLNTIISVVGLIGSIIALYFSSKKNDIFKILEEKNDEFGAVWGKLNRGWIPISDCRKL